MKKIIITMALCMASVFCASAQKWSVGTNILDYVNFGTLNAEGSVAVSRYITLNASVRYNPWTFRRYEKETQMQNRVNQYALGIRVWPWHIYSGWWFGARGQYQEYNRGGIRSQRTEEGDAFGLGLSAGYTFMLNKHLNLEFGAGLWGGGKSYAVFEYPRYGQLIDRGTTWFIMPNDLLFSLVWIF